MTQVNITCASAASFLVRVREIAAVHPPLGGRVGSTRCPAVADVMGGIGEETGSLLLTATLGRSISAAAWQTAGNEAQIRLITEGGQGPAAEFSTPTRALFDAGAQPEAIAELCRAAGRSWAIPSCLVLHQAAVESAFEAPTGGLAVVLESDIPPDEDFGRDAVQAAATLDAVWKLLGLRSDRLRQSRICANALAPLTGGLTMRTAMTALSGPPGAALLQLRFQPQVMCQALELPHGVIIMALRTQLARPTTLRRIVETRICSEMGRRMIADLRRQDGQPVHENAAWLAAITPTDYVEKFRDRLPSKITGKTFVARFGALRGLNGELDLQEAFKIRSRTEHHIYENRRVHEFATDIARARRSNSPDALVHAGELMYASHWSHSQRCGIGGVEPDQVVTCIRKHGPAAGLFGAKVTGGGNGGEMVVLMRDDARARAALAEAISKAESMGNRRIRTITGSLGGADHFKAPEWEPSLSSSSPA